MAIGRTNCGAGGSIGGFPKFTYTGDYTLLDDGDKNWRVKFLTSGTLTFDKNPGVIDVFLVGGGASGKRGQSAGGNGGCGGYTRTEKNIAIEPGNPYEIVIGAGGKEPGGYSDGNAGGASSAFGYTANGATKTYNNSTSQGGSGGGSTGEGGSDGSNGSGSSAGKGQGTTTREFGESTGDLYAGGGGGCINAASTKGGSGGGGNSSAYGGIKDGHANTGGGGGGGSNAEGGSGGSGIVIIRNHREAA